MFSDSEFMSAKEKEMILKQWKTFLKALKSCNFDEQSGADYGYYPTSLDKPFTTRLYRHLAGSCGFIAHYNRLGFLSARFGSPEAVQETIAQLEQHKMWGGYRPLEDLHLAMLAELRQAGLAGTYRTILFN